jgi:hypothetical protein
MGQLRHIKNEPHYLTQEEELEARRILLVGARKGDRKAKTELMESYGVKIYSEAERKRTKVVEPVTPSKQHARKQPKAVPLVHQGLVTGPSRKAGKKTL